MDLLLISTENKIHYVYTKDFHRFMFSKTKKPEKIAFAKAAHSALVINMYWQSISNFV